MPYLNKHYRICTGPRLTAQVATHSQKEREGRTNAERNGQRCRAGRNDAYCAVVSDLVSLIEQAIADDVTAGGQESSTNVIALDDVSPAT